MSNNKLSLIIKGIIKENPTFVLILGMCPTLGTTTSEINGLGMGVATMAVLILSNIFIAMIKNLIPDKVRIPAFIVVIASFVTVVDMLMQAFVPSLYASLGVFIPLGSRSSSIKRPSTSTSINSITDRSIRPSSMKS